MNVIIKVDMITQDSCPCSHVDTDVSPRLIIMVDMLLTVVTVIKLFVFTIQTPVKSY